MLILGHTSVTTFQSVALRCLGKEYLDQKISEQVNFSNEYAVRHVIYFRFHYQRESLRPSRHVLLSISIYTVATNSFSIYSNYCLHRIDKIFCFRKTDTVKNGVSNNSLEL